MKIDSYSPTIRRKEMDAVLTTMVGERVGPGEQSEKLIQYCRELLRFDYCLALRGPADALRLALKALSLEDGSGILISALSPAYYSDVIMDLRLVPIYADVEESSLSLTVDTVQAALSPAVRAIVIHHTLGYVPDTPAIVELGLPVIEDCSRSLGTNWLEQRAGSFGLFTILGLEERDVLTAGGGALLYAMARRDATVLRNMTALAPEFKLPDMNAALALAQFKEAERNAEKRKELAAIFTQSSLRTRHRRPSPCGESEYNNYTFPLILETGAKDVIAYASRKEVVVEMAFADSAVASRPREDAACPIANSLALRTVRFPLYPRLGKTQVAKVSKVLATLP